jgi:mannose-1-phosphate guanylyltransferase
VEDPTAFGLVETEPDGRIRRFLEKPSPDQITTNTINAGIYLLERELLDLIPLGRAASMEREFFPGLLERRIPCYGFAAQAYWRDIGNPEQYRLAQMDLLKGLVDTPLTPPGSRSGDVWVGAGVSIAPGPSSGPAVLGAQSGWSPKPAWAR